MTGSAGVVPPAGPELERGLRALVGGNGPAFSALFDDYPDEFYVGTVFGLLAMLVERKFGPTPSVAQLAAFAGRVHEESDDPQLPAPWLLETALRGAAGSRDLLVQSQSVALLEAVGLTLRALLADLSRRPNDDEELVAAAMPIVAQAFEIVSTARQQTS